MRKQKTRQLKTGRLERSPVTDVAICRFWDHIPQEEFHNALELAKDPRFEKLWSLLLDPGKRQLSFLACCKLADLTIVDLFEFWRQHTLYAGLIEMMSAFPLFAVDLATDIRSHMTACARCDGIGKVVDIAPGGDVGKPRVCPLCKGVKETRVVGDKSARDHLYSAIGITGKPTVAIQQNNFGLESELGDVLQMTQKVISGGGSE